MTSLYHQENKVIKGLFTLRFSKLVLLFFTLIFFKSVLANPEEGTVVAGNAIISSTHNNAILNIQQTSDKAVIDWKSFNIGSQEHVHFQQPHSTSMILNRVDPAKPSTILGSLSANGHVWISNPAGIFFGPESHIDVGGLLATTGWIEKPEDFMEGHFHFTSSSSSNTSVINEGTITAADEGLVALVAPGVANRGVIQANLGKVALASTTEFTVDFYGDQLINFGVNSTPVQKVPVDKDDHPLEAAVTHSGKIIANGGSVLIKAKTADGILNHMINLDGIVEGKTVVQRKGEIILLGEGDGIVKVSGKIDVSGKVQGESGGKLKIVSKKIALAAAMIDASGDNGGGEILVGGNYRGEKIFPAHSNAEYTLTTPMSILNANAISVGKGGKIIVWGDKTTQFYGTALARGGEQAGNGGLIEISGKEGLGYAGYTDTQAPLGKIGTSLLDPRNITVATGGTATLAQVDSFADTPSTDLTIDPATINIAASNVILQANRDILFNNSIAMTTPGVSLTAQAGRDITLASSVSIATNNGNITLIANDSSAQSTNRTNATSGDILMNTGSSINAGTSSINLTVGNLVVASPNTFTPGTITVIGLTGNNITLSTPSTITVSGTINATGQVSLSANTDDSGGQNFTMNAGSSITTTNTTSSAVTISVNTSGLVGTGAATLRDITTGSGGRITVNTFAGALSNVASTTLTAGEISLTTSGTAITLSGPVNTTGFVSLNGDTFTLNSAITTNGGNFSSNTTNGVTLNSGGTINSGTGTISFLVNQDGTAAQNFLMNSGSSLASTNNAISITVNTNTGGTGAATLRDINSGNGPLIVTTNNTGGTLSTVASTTISSGNITFSSGNALTLAGVMNATGLVSMAANTDGSAAGNFSMSAGSTLSTTSSASNAVTINVNTTAGGTGTATLRDINSGNGGLIVTTNNTGGTLSTIASTTISSGNITFSSGNAITLAGIINATGLVSMAANTDGSAGGNFSMSTGSTLSTTSSASNAVTINVNTASGGTGTATLRDITANGGIAAATDTGGNTTGGTLTISAGTTLTGANITLSSSNIITFSGNINSNGLIDIRANTNGAGGEDFTMSSGSSISTSSTSANAVAITVNTASGGTGGAALRDMTTGNGGGIQITIAPTGNTTGGDITQPSGILDTGSGNIQLIASQAAGVNVGTAALPMTIKAGSVSAQSGSSGIFITNTGTNPLILGTMNTTGSITLTSNTAISQTAPLTANTLTINSIGGMELNKSNSINTFNATNSGGGNLQLTNTASLLTISALTNSGGGNIVIDNSGEVSISDNVTVQSNNGNIMLTASDLNLNSTGAINAGSGDLYISQNTSGGALLIGTGSGTMTISNSELQRLTANNLNFLAASEGQIIVNAVPLSDTNNISGIVNLIANSGNGSITIQGGISEFRTLNLTATDNMTIASGSELSITSGPLYFVGHSAEGTINTPTLVLDVDLANLFGLINNKANEDAFPFISLLNTIRPGTHFFNRIDLFQSFFQVDIQFLFPNETLFAKENDLFISDNPFLYGMLTLEPLVDEETGCLKIGNLITMCLRVDS